MSAADAAVAAASKDTAPKARLRTVLFMAASEMNRAEPLDPRSAQGALPALEKLRRSPVRCIEFIAMFKLNSAESLSSSKLISLRKPIFDCCRTVAAREAILATPLASLARHAGIGGHSHQRPPASKFDI